MKANLERGLLTMHEIAFVQIFITSGGNRTACKQKVNLQLAKAKNDKVDTLIHSTVRTLVSRAEAGRDLGPKASDPDDPAL